MKKLTLMLVLGLASLAGTAQGGDGQLTEKFDQLLNTQFKSDEPGATALVARNGQIIYHKAIGMANLELNVPMQTGHVFRIGSITKQFTAVAVLQLMEQGKLSLQDDITRFIPDYPTHGYHITIEHLLTHTSGIASYTSEPDYMKQMSMEVSPKEMIDRFKNLPMNFAPGTQWRYSNSGYFLLGYIIEVITGKPYSAYVEENFFKPLGMTNSYYGDNADIIKNRVSGYSIREQGFENAALLSMTQPYAAGSILSTVEDLHKWNVAVQSYKLVNKENLDRAFTAYKLADGSVTNYGYGWQIGTIQESATVEHGGGINGSLTMAIYLPKEQVFVAIFSNCDGNSPGELAARMAAVAIGKPYERTAIAVDAASLPEYTGVYENEKGEQRIITSADNQLYSQRGRNPKFVIKAYEKDKFFFEDALLTMNFSRNRKGQITQLITYGRKGNEVWTKTNKPIPVITEIKVDPKILDTYVGTYMMTPEFGFTVTRSEDSLFVQATDQQRFQVFAEAPNKFFTKFNDAQFEFVTDETGKVTKVLLLENGRASEAVRKE